VRELCTYMMVGVGMANEDQLAILRSGVEQWNQWRRYHPDIHVDLTQADLNNADLREANLREADLTQADLRLADLRGADLTRAHLHRAYLFRTKLTGAYLVGMDLNAADLVGADLSGANLQGADLRRADLIGANLRGADLSGAKLIGASLARTHLEHAILDGCYIYGISAWDLHLDGTRQANLRITLSSEPEILVDNLEVAQFLHMMLNNQAIRAVIDTITSKVVLILGRFSNTRKPVLEALRDALRARGYVPVLFDFEPSVERNLTETITLLARMARFVIADLTEPVSIPQELQAIVPDVQVAVRPIIAKGFTPYALFADFHGYPWMLDVYTYTDLDGLVASIEDEIIAPAEAKVKAQREK
jgi:hypothetical protein